MKRLAKALSLALVAIIAIAAPVLAFVYSATYTVAESGNISYEMFPATVNASNQWMVDNGFFQANALDTRVETLAGGVKPHMVVDDRTLSAIPVPAYSQTNLYFTTGNSDLTTMDIISGYGGWITASDNDTFLEPGGNFTIKQNVWVNTDNGADKDLVDKTGAFSLFVSQTVSENVTAATTSRIAINLIPNATGTLNDISGETGVAAPNHWQNVDEPEGAPNDADFNTETSVIFHADSYNVDNVTATVNATARVRSVSVYFRILDAGAQDCEARPGLLLYGANTTGTIITNTDGNWHNYNETLARPGGGAWQYSDLNDLEVIIELRQIVGAAQCSQVFIKVVYDELLATVTATGVASGNHTVTTKGELCLDFDGTSDYITAIDAPQLDGHATMSWEWRGRVDGAGGSPGQGLIDKVGVGATDSYLFWTQFATQQFSSRVYGTALVTHVGTATWTTGEWFHYIVTYDGADIIGYFNGVPDGSTPAVIGNVLATTSHLTLGCSYDFVNNDLHGSLAEVKIYSGVISATEALNRANGGKPDDTGLTLVAYYPIDEGTGTTIDDASSYGNDGTAVGTSWDIEVLKIYIDNVFRDISAIVAVPNTSADWTFLDNATNLTCPYADNMTIDIGGVERLYYAPNSMIIGTHLPDRATGNSNNGTFHWGNNPSGIAVTLGSMISAYQPSIGATLDEPSQDIMHDVEASDWFEAPDLPGTLATNPLRPFVTIMSDTTNITELQAWRFLGLVFILFITVGTASKVRGHMGIAGIACGASIGLLVAMTIWPLWALTFAIAGVIGGLVMERSPSL